MSAYDVSIDLTSDEAREIALTSLNAAARCPRGSTGHAAYLAEANAYFAAAEAIERVEVRDEEKRRRKARAEAAEKRKAAPKKATA